MQQQSMPTPRTPASLEEVEDDTMKQKLLHGAFALGALLVLVACLCMNGSYLRFINEKFYQRNSFRFIVIMLILVMCLATYLILSTDKKEKNKAQQMIDQHPVAAYSMTACALLLIVYSFIFSLELMNIIGVVFFMAFWVMFYHLLFVIA